MGGAVHALGTFVVLTGVTLALKFVPYRVLARRLPPPGVRKAEAWRKRRLLRDMERAARWIPGATCLPQAMTGYLLFARRGLDARIRIGVDQSPVRGFRAHATLVSGGDVVIGGGEDADAFVHLVDLRPGG